ncbi:MULTISPECIES: hypothetical protein [Agrobacterium]|uniref:hypothetical protein n=1 Tax=Agrobacterium TaxID=357 RepID=UPI0009BB7F2F|nr:MULTISPECIES: hypothetical protein [Agrobacterium]QCL72199.1 hypothetical protein CFBP5499_01240 [Agrobacterium tumefaciens]CUX23017.1 hypothetical protein AGR6A_Cc150079 [Agrobacterium sp. NCPPB 925]
MRLLSWWRLPKVQTLPDPEIEKEKRDRKADLAQAVVTFERRRDRVQRIAEETVVSMQKGSRR